MADTEMIDAHVDPGLKHEAEAVFAELGLSVEEAITLFYRQVTLQHGLPLTVKVPNADTCEALRQAHEGEDLIEYPTLEALKAAHR